MTPETTPTTCARCGYAGPFRVCGDGQTDGRIYGRTNDGVVYCDVCCGDVDQARMIETGRATLYLTTEPNLTPAGNPHGRKGTVSNWPGSIKFQTGPVMVGRHNIARLRYDVWFTGPDGKTWHGVQYGDNTQICHCRRVKG